MKISRIVMFLTDFEHKFSQNPQKRPKGPRRSNQILSRRDSVRRHKIFQLFRIILSIIMNT